MARMPHLFCGGGGEAGSRVACETIAVPGCSDAGDQPDVSKAHANDADAPAEPRCVWIGDGAAVWAELAGGAVLGRDGSTKGSSNPKAVAAYGKGKKGGPWRLPIAGKTAVVIGGLPVRKMVAQKRRRSPCLGRVWRRPAAAAGARVFAIEAVETDPGSPKVSCFGAVRSERPTATATASAPPVEADEERTSGCWASVATALNHLCRSPSNQLEGERGANESKANAPAPPPVTALSPPRPVAVGLGDMKRLASRRWTETMAVQGPVISAA